MKDRSHNTVIWLYKMTNQGFIQAKHSWAGKFQVEYIRAQMKIPKDKAISAVSVSHGTKEFSEQSLAILMKEHDTLRELYTQAENHAQNIFNFYLALVTTVIGGVVVISQFPASSMIDRLKSQLLIMGVVFFATTVGSIFSTALTARYANMARYAYCIDEIRKILLNSVNVTLPGFYDSLLKPHINPKRRKGFFHTITSWLAPTGTYHFFVSIINSACLSIVLWLFWDIVGLAQNNLSKSISASLIVFTILYFVYNFFSHMLMLQIISSRKAQLGIRSDFVESMLKES